MITVITGAAVAFFQSTRIERFVSRNYADLARAQLAAEAGLAAGRATLLNAITNGRIGTNQWNYISGHLSTHPQIPAKASNAEADAFAFIAQTDPANGTVLQTTYLASTSAAALTTWIPLGRGAGDPRYPAHWTNLVTAPAAGQTQTNARYAFWISDDTTKLNLRAMGLGDPASKAAADPSTVPLRVRLLVTTNVATLLPANAISALSSTSPQLSANGTVTNRGWHGLPLVQRETALLTPSSVGVFMKNANFGVPQQSLENDLARETLSAPVAPNGRPKLNLTRLKTYLDSLPRSQAPGNLRYQRILDILDSGATAVHTNWGGGDLSFLMNPAIMVNKYTSAEARQFVANLFDAIDEDFIPTTDNENNPTVFGVEMRMQTPAGGTSQLVQGHPYVTYVGIGHYAGSSRVRTHMAVGFVNPWPQPSEPWTAYSVELEATPSSPPFPSVMNEEMAGMPTTVRAANGGISARTGGLFPCANAAAQHYSAFVNQRPGRIDNLTFTIRKALLRYNSSDGGSYLVARVPPGATLRALPANVPDGGDNVNRFAYDLKRDAYWAQADPRLATTATAGNWTTIPNGAGGANGIIPAPSTTIFYMASPSTGDGNQGLARRVFASTDPNNWYRSTSITNHFNLDGSLYFDGTKTRIRGVGFLGYLSVGKPWQTLTLHNQNLNNPAGQEDWKILDYVYSGDEIYTTNEIAHVDMAGDPYAADKARGAWPGNFSRDGSVNAFSGNRNTWRAILEGVSLPAGTTAESLANSMASNTAVLPSVNLLSFLKTPALSSAWSGTEVNDFAREKLVRSLADSLTIRSRSFTIHAMGESLATNATGNSRSVARSLMLSRVRLGVNTNLAVTAAGNGGGVTLEIIETKSY